VGFVRNKVVLGQISVGVLRCFLSVSFHQHLTLIRRFLTGTIEDIYIYIFVYTPINFGMINQIYILFYYQGLIGNQFRCQFVVIDKQGMCSWSDTTRSVYVCTVMCPVKAGSVGLTHRRRLASGSRPTDRLVAEAFQLQASE